MKLFSTLLLTIFSLTVFAQSNYHAGYVVKSNGDTLKGFIDYREWAQSPLSIHFKQTTIDKDLLTFNPQTINSFGVTGLEKYVSYAGLVTISKNLFPDLPDHLDTTRREVTIFIKEITAGRYLTLYYQNDQAKKRYFIAEGNNKPIELRYFQYYNDQKDVTEKWIYRGDFATYINKYKNGDARLMDKVYRMDFNMARFSAMVDEINDTKTVSKKASGIRLFAGLTGNYLTTTYQNSNFVVVGDYGSSFYNIKTHSGRASAAVNLGFDVFVNPNVQQFVFRTELSFSSASTHIDYPKRNQHPFVYDELSFTQFTSSLMPQLIYNFYNKENFKLYFDAGTSINLSSYSNQGIKDKTTGIDVNNRLVYHPFGISFPLRAGITISKRADISVFYTTPAKAVHYTDEKVDYQITGISLKIFFSKNRKD